MTYTVIIDDIGDDEVLKPPKPKGDVIIVTDDPDEDKALR